MQVLKLNKCMSFVYLQGYQPIPLDSHYYIGQQVDFFSRFGIVVGSENAQLDSERGVFQKRQQGKNP